MAKSMPATRATATAAPSLTAVKKAIAKPTKAKTITLATVSREQFEAGLADALNNAKTSSAGLRTGCIYVAQQTSFKTQDEAITKVAKVYAQVSKLIDGDHKEMSNDTARKWVKRNAAKLYPAFKILKSENQKAKEQRERNAKKGANANKAKADANSGSAGQTEGKASAPAFKALTVQQMKREIGDTMENLYDTLSGSIPVANLDSFRQLQAAFVTNAAKLLVAVKPE